MSDSAISHEWTTEARGAFLMYALLGAISLLASCLPARRAMRADLMASIRAL
jgi:hypothetical protein